jgi:phenylpyruvate tautomerase PptA (4-oxalocrotonate tautomerase family)
MPYIQVDVRAGLSGSQLAELRRQIVEVVHESIGSARPHINVAIRELPPDNLVEAGQTEVAEDVSR